MRRLFLLLIFVLSFCCTSRAENRKLALLIGVDDYANVSSLECCVNDMKALKEALKKIDFDENDIKTLLTGGNKFKDLPTKKNIERCVSQLLSDAQPSDMVLIAFSGHGAQEGEKVYFCPPETELNDLEGTCVSVNKVMNDLANCKAKFKLMVVDACRNDPNQGSKGIGGNEWLGISSPPDGFALFQSCAEGEESWEDLVCGNSFFTKNFVAALSGEADADHDGKLTLFEVCTWTSAHTKAQVQSSLKKSQKPFLNLSASDFTLSENRKILIAKELVEEARKAIKEENYALAIQKFDEALKLYSSENWVRERDIAKVLFKQEQTLNDTDSPKIQSTSRSSFEWKGSKITEFIGNETRVVIPEGTTRIGATAFLHSSIESIVLQKGVTNIENFAFIHSSSLTSIEIPTDLSAIGYGAFSDCPSLKIWHISPANPYFKSSGIALLTKDGKKLIACPGAEGKYKIPEGVAEIGNRAFNSCQSIKSVVIPHSTRVIGERAFEDCRYMTSVVIPEGVTDIENFAFDKCTSLISIVIPESVTKIGNDAFSGCSKLTIYAPSGSTAEEYAKKAGISFQAYPE